GRPSRTAQHAGAGSRTASVHLRNRSRVPLLADRLDSLLRTPGRPDRPHEADLEPALVRTARDVGNNGAKRWAGLARRAGPGGLVGRPRWSPQAPPSGPHSSGSRCAADCLSERFRPLETARRRGGWPKPFAGVKVGPRSRKSTCEQNHASWAWKLGNKGGAADPQFDSDSLS